MHMANEQYQQNSHKWKTWQLGFQTLERYWASFQVTRQFHSATIFSTIFFFLGGGGGVVLSSNAFTIWCCIPISRPPRVQKKNFICWYWCPYITITCRLFQFVNLEARKSYLLNKLHIFQCMCKILCVEFHGYLSNCTQNMLPIHWQILFLYNVERALRLMTLYAFFKCPPGPTHVWGAKLFITAYKMNVQEN